MDGLSLYGAGMRRRTGLVALVLLAAGCSGGGDALAERDPKGAEACDALAQAFRDKNNTDAAIAGSAKAGAAADQSTTPAIKAATIDLAGTKVADPQALRQACVDAGVDVPEVPAG
jgi:hypothetical protein